MRGRLTPALLGVGAASSLLLVMPPSAAQVPPSGESQGYGELINDDTAQVEARYGQTGAGAEGPGTSGDGYSSPITCEFYPTGRTGGTSEPLSLVDLQALYEAQVTAGQEGVWIDGVCFNEESRITWSDNFLWTPGTPLVPPDVLAEMAAEQLDMPPPNGGMSPSLESGTFAQLDTYFWSSNWRTPADPVSASASAGPLTVTVNAHTIQQSWAISDTVRGETYHVVCDGPGVPWDATAVDRTSPAGACVWEDPPHSSAGQNTTDDQGRECFPATVRFTWHVEWTATNGQSEVLPNGTSVAGDCIFVDEIQALVTDG